jgi:hypothetical protein
MADLFLLSEAQMRRIEGYFPLSHGIARVDDRGRLRSRRSPRLVVSAVLGSRDVSQDDGSFS